MLRKLLKQLVFGLAVVIVSPLFGTELLCRILFRRPLLFKAQSQCLSVFPGTFGSFLRTAYYYFTLSRCPSNVVISFGSMFTHPEAQLGESVYIGSRCIIGMVSIGEKTMLADAIYILSGRNQHGTEAGVDYQEQEGRFTQLSIGRNCWIGTNTVVMANIGDNSIIGAGSVVTKDIPANSRAAGSPARIIRSAQDETSTASV